MLIRLLGCAAAATLLAACSGDQLAPLHPMLGNWSGIQRLAGDATGYSAQYHVHETDGGLSWNFHSDWNGGFTGQSAQRWDAASKEFV